MRHHSGFQGLCIKGYKIGRRLGLDKMKITSLEQCWRWCCGYYIVGHGRRSFSLVGLWRPRSFDCWVGSNLFVQGWKIGWYHSAFVLKTGHDPLWRYSNWTVGMMTTKIRNGRPTKKMGGVIGIQNCVNGDIKNVLCFRFGHETRDIEPWPKTKPSLPNKRKETNVSYLALRLQFWQTTTWVIRSLTSHRIVPILLRTNRINCCFNATVETPFPLSLPLSSSSSSSNPTQ